MDREGVEPVNRWASTEFSVLECLEGSRFGRNGGCGGCVGKKWVVVEGSGCCFVGRCFVARCFVVGGFARGYFLDYSEAYSCSQGLKSVHLQEAEDLRVKIHLIFQVLLFPRDGHCEFFYKVFA